MGDAGLSSLPAHGTAVVLGATGGIGAAIYGALRASGRFAHVVGYGRRTEPALEITDEAAVAAVAADADAYGAPLRLVFDATGVLHDDSLRPEKSWRHLDADTLQRAFAVNATGPALAMKHFLPRLPRQGKAVFATLSARVGSIGDNRAGGWYGYRAAKAALNQLTHTAAIELGRRWPEAVCVALHPGTTDTPMTQPFSKTGLTVRSPEVAAHEVLTVVDGLTPADSGGFRDQHGEVIPW
jgi:NAD(P)-dependent dehydrogenase (short-subunit alcohol dehydrogenase family)